MSKKDPLDEYSPAVLDHMRNPRNWGIVPDGDGYGRISGTCGDTMEISLRIKEGVITQCTFDSDGCGATVACGSIVTALATGKTVTQARRLDGPALLEYCGGLPKNNEHCAFLAADTLKKALEEFGNISGAPWKRFYRSSR